METPALQGLVRVDGPLTPLPRALTPAERGQGLSAWRSSRGVVNVAWRHCLREVLGDPSPFAVPVASIKPLPPLRGGEGARQRFRMVHGRPLRI
jgi:hypothetical protein